MMIILCCRLRQWEGMSCGYQSTHSNSQSMCGQSDKSTSVDSTGPSNNTGSTNLSQQLQNNGGYSRPFQHIPSGPALGQMSVVSGGAVHSKLVGQLGPYSSHGHSSSNMSNLYTPLVNVGSKPSNVANLQMV